eukprot:9425117-Karenia_brevis.AAC.1
MERHIATFRGEGERIVDTMQDIMVDLRDNNLESVARAGRSERGRDIREINQITSNRVMGSGSSREFINPRGRWEEEESP